MKSLVSILFASVAAVAAADAGDVTAERFPDADNVLVYGFEDVVYKPDGSYAATSEEKVKILTEKGRRDNSDIELVYSERYGKAEVLYAAIISEDGTMREIDVAANTKIAVDNSSESENIYDPKRKKLVCAVPGLKIGDTLHYKTRRENFTSRVKDLFADIYVMEWECPILHQVVRITSPAEKPLKKMAIRHPLGNVVSKVLPQEDGSVVREWVMDGQTEQVFPEPDMPALYTQVQSLKVSTAEDWREISRWYWELCRPHLEKANAAISNKVDEIGHDISAIYKWVSQEVRYMGLTMEAESPGYAPHDVDITFANKYGVCRDKAALLAAMLRIAGFKAYPVLIHAGDRMDEEVPMPYFNHAITAVEKEEGGYMLLDPTDESSRDTMPAYLSGKSFLVAKPEGETLLVSPVPDARSNAVTVESDASLGKDGAMLVESTIRFSGINDNLYRNTLLRYKKDARRKFFERQLGALAPGAELLDIKISPSDLQDTATPLEVRLVASIPGTLIEGETRSEFVAPLVSKCFGTANWMLEGKTSLERRKYPLRVDSTAMVDETLTLRLNGETGAALKLPDDVAIEGDFEYRRSFAREGDTMTVKRLVAVNAIEFSPEEYAKARESLKAMEAAERERPVFANDFAKGANIRVLEDRTDVHIASPTAWVVTNTIEELVLSYDGKKKYSELKFDYNPSWKNVEIIYATVSNRDGKVSRLVDGEISVFDASWAASARRYPATKRLIASLPGVEVGSVIRYSCATTVTNAPAPFYGKWSFDSSEPVDRMSLWIDGELVKERTGASAIVPEPMMADGDLWQDSVIVSKGDWGEAAKNLRKAAKVGAYGKKGPWGESVQSIRDWMAKNVKVSGPGLYETPLDAQLASVETVLEERYASRLDYMRTLCSLLKGAGFDADIVFASRDAEDPAEIAKRDMEEKPRVRAFSNPLVRVRENAGGWLWFGGETVTEYLGTENQYAPIGASAYARSHFFDPETETFGVVEAASAGLLPFEKNEFVFHVRENGAVDLDVESEMRGPGVAAFRKKYAEMLPEDRSRHYQKLLGEFSHAATATGDLTIDTEGYPATMSFKAYIPDYAVVNGDAITLTLSTFFEQLYPLSPGKRRHPIGIGPSENESTVVKIVFPEGYSTAEHLPESFTFGNPLDANAPMYESRVSSEIVDGRLVVTISRFAFQSGRLTFPPAYAQLFRDWSRMASSRANRTITARKAE